MTAIILTGGTSKRFGSDKSQARIGEKTFLELLYSFLDDDDVIIVGNQTSLPARYTREDPELGGPLAGIAAALELVDNETVSIFATDMPFAPLVLPTLRACLKKDAVLPIDAEGIPQRLAALYRTEPLRRAIACLPSAHNQSVRSVIDTLASDSIQIEDADLLIDIDTPDLVFKAIEIQSRLSL